MNDDKTLSFQDLLQIVELIKSSAQFGEFHLKTGDFELDIRRASAADGVEHAASTGNGATQSARVSDNNSAQRANDAMPVASAPTAPAAPPAPAAPQKTASSVHGAMGRALPADLPADAIIVKSPMVGTGYRAAEPGAAPFVEVGAQVAADATVCIIEVMKLMNSLPAGVSGTVTHVLFDDAEPVEYGQPLVVIAPSGASA